MIFLRNWRCNSQPSRRTTSIPLCSMLKLRLAYWPAMTASKLFSLRATYFFFISKIKGLKIPSMSISKLLYSLLMFFFNYYAMFLIFINSLRFYFELFLVSIDFFRILLQKSYDSLVIVYLYDFVMISACVQDLF